MISSQKVSQYILSSILVLLLFSPVTFADSLDSKLKEIEKNYYGYSLSGSLESRLSNIEKDLYGKTNSGLSKNRVDKLYKDLNMGISTGFASPVVQDSLPQQNIGPKADAGIKYPIVDKIEQKVFNKTFSDEDIYLRLSRLEKQTFKKESTLSLNERVDALRSRVLGGDKTATAQINPYTEEIILENGKKYYGDGINESDSNYNYYSYENSKNRVQKPTTKNYDEAKNSMSFSGQNYDLDILEKQLFGKRFTQESPSQRLTRLENKVFERTFSDGENSRIQRLLAVTTAQKTSKEYDSNRWAQRLNAGMQIGSILLMVLAMIL